MDNLANARNDRHQTITVQLYSHRDDSYCDFSVTTKLKVGELLQRLLDHLAQGIQAKRLQQFCENFAPGLELLQDGEWGELDDALTLHEAGIGDNATVRISARPIKEKVLFCRYASCT